MKPSVLVVASAVVVSGVLMAVALYGRGAVHEASELVVRGSSVAFGRAGQEALRVAGDGPVDPKLLEGLLAAQSAEGLRYVGVRDELGAVLAEAGVAQFSTPPAAENGLEVRGDRARLVWRIRGFRTFVYEFEPIAAAALESQARRLVWVSALACLGILALAFALARSLKQREGIQAELEKGRRLAALGQMSAVLAHELRNPLASLKGHAQLLVEDLEQTPALKPMGDRVVAEAQRLEQRMNDLLAFARGDALSRAAVDPLAVLRSAVDAVGADRIDVQAVEGMKVSMDAGLMQQAMENVLRNAVEASPEGRKVEAVMKREGGKLTLTVRDHGAGFAKGDEEKAFEPFVTRKVKGVGLGLAVTRRIVELHGGTIHARNAADGGAQLEIEIPAKEA